MKAYVYWLHLPEHADMMSEGYIGVAVDHNKRFKDHKKEATKRNHINPHLQAAFRKYGDQIQKHVIWLGEETLGASRPFNLHLALSARERERQVALLARSREFASLPFGVPTLVAGDYNDWRSLLRPFFVDLLGSRSATGGDAER